MKKTRRNNRLDPGSGSNRIRRRQGTPEMVEDRPEELESPPDPGRAKRAPPTIDLEATEISGETKPAATDAGAGRGPGPKPSSPRNWRGSIFPNVISAVSGAGAAGLVIAIAWLMGWPGEAARAARAGGQSGRDRWHRGPSRQRRIQNQPARAAAPDPGRRRARRGAGEIGRLVARSSPASRAQSEKLAPRSTR